MSIVFFIFLFFFFFFFNLSLIVNIRDKPGAAIVIMVEGSDSPHRDDDALADITTAGAVNPAKECAGKTSTGGVPFPLAYGRVCPSHILEKKDV